MSRQSPAENAATDAVAILRYMFSPNAASSARPPCGGSTNARTASLSATVKRQTAASITPSLPPSVSADISIPAAIYGTPCGAAASHAKPNGLAPSSVARQSMNATQPSTAPRGSVGAAARAAAAIRAPVLSNLPRRLVPARDASRRSLLLFISSSLPFVIRCDPVFYYIPA